MLQIQCNNLSLGYEGKIVLKDISFTVKKADYLCIIGENGAGKSTLMKALLGLIQPYAGEIIFSGGVKSTEIGYLPQQTQVQKDFPASVKEVVLSGVINGMGCRPFYSKAERQLAKENMKKLDVLHLEKRCYRELSGGQRQRVLLARALCASKEILLLDEPTAGLDELSTKELYACLDSMNKEGMTMIMISHDLKEAVARGSHILHLGGEQQFFGKKEEWKYE